LGGCWDDCECEEGSRWVELVGVVGLVVVVVGGAAGRENMSMRLLWLAEISYRIGLESGSNPRIPSENKGDR
jgi:hypothetical protein